MASCLSSCHRYILCPQLGLVLQLLTTNLEEVLLDGQLFLQLSEVAVHEGSVFGAQLRIVRVLLVNVSNSLTKNMAIKKNRLHDFMNI
jgi:hypothetical protein